MNKTFKDFLEEQSIDLLDEGATSPALANNKMIARASSAIPSMDKKDAEQTLRAVYDAEILTIANEVMGEFENMVKSTLRAAKYRRLQRQPTFLRQIKTPSSLVDKVVDRKRPLLQIADIVRGALIFDDESVLQDFVSDIRRKFSSVIDDYEFKEMGKDKEFGYYGSHHFDLMIGGMLVELQITTKKLWAYKAAAHKIYTDLRSEKSARERQDKYDNLPDSIKRLLNIYPQDRDDAERSAKALSKRIFARGNQPRLTREDVDPMLENLESICESDNFIQSVVNDLNWEPYNS